MTTITRQQLIRDFTNLLKTRGLRLAALVTGSNGVQSSDWYKVYTHVSGNLSAPDADVYRIVMDFDKDILDTLDERATGSEYNIPVPGRV
jgi:hypothetical protein